MEERTNEMSRKKSTFEQLYALDASGKIRKKQSLSYISWAAAWAEVKKVFPDASFRVYPQTMDELGNTRFWHDDGRTGWVDVGVTIENKEERVTLPIMNARNQSIPAGEITSFDANKAQMRCLVKALALHGAFMHIFEGEDLPEEVSQNIELQSDILALMNKKAALSDKAKAQVEEICKAAEAAANPQFEASEITGDPRNIDDGEALEKLKRQLLAVRK